MKEQNIRIVVDLTEIVEIVVSVGRKPKCFTKREPKIPIFVSSVRYLQFMGSQQYNPPKKRTKEKQHATQTTDGEKSEQGNIPKFQCQEVFLKKS